MSLYCPNCNCSTCSQQTAHLHQRMSSIKYAYPPRTPKKTITCGWCHEEHKDFKELQWCRRTIDERTRRTFEEAAVAAWEFFETLQTYASESDHSSDPQN